jgi:hypothetical protein
MGRGKWEIVTVENIKKRRQPKQQLPKKPKIGT